MIHFAPPTSLPRLDVDPADYDWLMEPHAAPRVEARVEARDTSLDHIWHDQADFDALRAIYDRIDRVLQIAIPMIVTTLGVLVFARVLWAVCYQVPA